MIATPRPFAAASSINWPLSIWSMVARHVLVAADIWLSSKRSNAGSSPAENRKPHSNYLTHRGSYSSGFSLPTGPRNLSTFRTVRFRSWKERSRRLFICCRTGSFAANVVHSIPGFNRPTTRRCFTRTRHGGNRRCACTKTISDPSL